jgi:hypothetical protein
MKKDREAHLAGILAKFNEEFPVKYRRGDKEHGGRLEDRPCLEEALNEVLDLWAYLSCERQKMSDMRDALIGHGIGLIDAEHALERIKVIYNMPTCCSRLTPTKPRRKQKA